MCFISYMHYVLCLVQKASLHTKEKLIQCLYQVENHLLNIPGRLKNKEKSIRWFFIQAERSKEIDQCNFSKTCPLCNQNNLCKSKPLVYYTPAAVNQNNHHWIIYTSQEFYTLKLSEENMERDFFKLHRRNKYQRLESKFGMKFTLSSSIQHLVYYLFFLPTSLQMSPVKTSIKHNAIKVI